MMEEIRQLVERRLRETGKSARQVSLDVAGHDSVVKDLRAGRVPRADRLKSLCKALGLEFHVGLPRAETGTGNGSAGTGDDFVEVPYYGATLGAGEGAVNPDLPESIPLAFRRSYLRHHVGHTRAENLAVVTVRGDSMEPTLTDGDVVLIDLNDVDKRDGVWALVLEDSALVKRLQFTPGALLLKSDNEAYETLRLDAHDTERARLIGRVKWVGKSM